MNRTIGTTSGVVGDTTQVQSTDETREESDRAVREQQRAGSGKLAVGLTSDADTMVSTFPRVLVLALRCVQLYYITPFALIRTYATSCSSSTLGTATGTPPLSPPPAAAS